MNEHIARGKPLPPITVSPIPESIEDIDSEAPQSDTDENNSIQKAQQQPQQQQQQQYQQFSNKSNPFQLYDSAQSPSLAEITKRVAKEMQGMITVLRTTQRPSNEPLPEPVYLNSMLENNPHKTRETLAQEIVEDKNKDESEKKTNKSVSGETAPIRNWENASFHEITNRLIFELQQDILDVVGIPDYPAITPTVLF